MQSNTNENEVRGALLALSLPILMASLDTSITNTALPVLAGVFSASFPAVQWIVLSYLLTVTTLIVSVGRLGDLVGRRRLLEAGIVLFSLASLLCGVAPSLGVLIVARAAQGVGAAVMMAIGLAFVGDTIPRERTGRAMGLLGTMSAIGTAFGPSLGGLLVAGPGWRWLFLVNLPVGLLNLLLVRRYLPEARQAPKSVGAGFDLKGTSLLAGTLAAYALAMTLEQGDGGLATVLLPTGLLSTLLLLAAVIGAALFARVEARATAPLVRLELFRDRSLTGSLISGALVSAVIMSTLVVGPFYLARALELPPAVAGALLSVGPLVVALVGVPAGRLADRHGAGRTARAGLLLMLSGSLALSLLPIRLGALGYLVPLAVLTTGYALFQTANNTSVMSGIPADVRGTYSGLLNLSRNLGLITGASAMGAVFALGSGSIDTSTAPPEAIAAGLHLTFVAAAGLVAAALAISTASIGATQAPTGRGLRDAPSRDTAQAADGRSGKLRDPRGCGPAGRTPVGVAMNTAVLADARRSDWLTPALLVLLSLVPAIAGTARLAELAMGAEPTEANARFVASPVPVVLHLLAVVPYSLLGAFQFAPRFRRRNRLWHRVAGMALVGLGTMAALTGLWMAHFYPWPDGDGVAVYVERLFFGGAMLASLALAVRAIVRRDFVAHGAWMTRAYAIGLGAGTQVLTHLPYFILVGKPDETARGIMMGAGWVINLLVAERLIWSRRQRPDSRATPAGPVLAP